MNTPDKYVYDLVTKGENGYIKLAEISYNIDFANRVIKILRRDPQYVNVIIDILNNIDVIDVPITKDKYYLVHNNDKIYFVKPNINKVYKYYVFPTEEVEISVLNKFRLIRRIVKQSNKKKFPNRYNVKFYNPPKKINLISDQKKKLLKEVKEIEKYSILSQRYDESSDIDDIKEEIEFQGSNKSIIEELDRDILGRNMIYLVIENKKFPREKESIFVTELIEGLCVNPEYIIQNGKDLVDMIDKYNSKKYLDMYPSCCVYSDYEEFPKFPVNTKKKCILLDHCEYDLYRAIWDPVVGSWPKNKLLSHPTLPDIYSSLITPSPTVTPTLPTVPTVPLVFPSISPGHMSGLTGPGSTGISSVHGVTGSITTDESKKVTLYNILQMVKKYDNTVIIRNESLLNFPEEIMKNVGYIFVNNLSSSEATMKRIYKRYCDIPIKFRLFYSMIKNTKHRFIVIDRTIKPNKIYKYTN